MSGVITALEIQKRNKERVNVYLDGEYAFAIDAIQASKLRKGQHLTNAEIAALRDEDAVGRALDSAVRFLAVRPRSSHEVRQNLLRKKIAEPVIIAVMERLEAMGYLDDRAFAQFWVENRNSFRPSGPQALRYELRQKGISKDIIEAVLAQLGDEDQAAYAVLVGQAWRWRGQNKRYFKEKGGALLRRRGFDYEAISAALDQFIRTQREEDPTFFDEETNDDGGTNLET